MNLMGIGFDAHRFAKKRRLVLGGCEIPYKLGLLGHSDADVLCHAVMDAMLGAVADGDIGHHFPNNDNKWRGVSSIELLKKVTAIVRKRKFTVVNIDTTVLADAPKLKDYILQMRRNIAKTVGITTDRVSVKATTMEGMGAIGRKEGIAAMAVVSVEDSRKNK